MSAARPLVPLGQLVELSKGVSYKGEFLDQPGRPLLGLGVFAPGGGYLAGKDRSYSGSFKAHHSVEPGALFLALTDITQEGHVLGSPAKVPVDLGPSLITHHVAAVRVTAESGIDADYLYHALRSDYSRSQFRGMATGTTVRAVSIADACRVRIPVPDIAEQRRIGSMLGQFDEWIASIDRTIAILETIIMEQFRLVFFPNGEHAQTNRAERAYVPETAGNASISDLIDFDPRVKIRVGEPTRFVDMKAIPVVGPCIPRWVTRRYSGGCRFMLGDTLFARITPCLENGKTALVDFLEPAETAAGSTELVVMRAKEGLSKAIPYCWAKSESFRRHAIANLTGSSGRQRVSASALAGFQIRIPEPSKLHDFGGMADVLLDGISAKYRTRQAVAALRDQIIPKLVSGEIRYIN